MTKRKGIPIGHPTDSIPKTKRVHVATFSLYETYHMEGQNARDRAESVKSELIADGHQAIVDVSFGYYVIYWRE